jgi:hypothetical protein
MREEVEVWDDESAVVGFQDGQGRANNMRTVCMQSIDHQFLKLRNASVRTPVHVCPPQLHIPPLQGGNGGQVRRGTEGGRRPGGRGHERGDVMAHPDGLAWRLIRW